MGGTNHFTWGKYLPQHPNSALVSFDGGVVFFLVKDAHVCAKESSDARFSCTMQINVAQPM
jgi:hypothetical protein